MNFTNSNTLDGAGYVDFHCHADRAFTFAPEYFGHQGPMEAFIDASLPVKQITLGVVHRGLAYTTENLRARMTRLIEAKIAAGETELHAIVDCSPDIEGRAFMVALELRDKYAAQIDIYVGAYPIFGFKTFDSDRHKHLEECAKLAQFLVGLPERDARHDHPIGFDGHLSAIMDLALEYRLPVQVHVDQTNTPGEGGLERLIEAVRWKVTNLGLPEHERPKVWAVHAISPSAYDETRFWRMVEGLRENNIGIICSPHAAISMRQRREQMSPTHNSIARVREFAWAGVDVRFGTDNINDLLMPLPMCPLVRREFDILASSIRYYNTAVLGKLFRGEVLNETDRDSLARSLQGDYEAFGWTLPKLLR